MTLKLLKCINCGRQTQTRNGPRVPGVALASGELCNACYMAKRRHELGRGKTVERPEPVIVIEPLTADELKVQRMVLNTVFTIAEKRLVLERLGLARR